MISPQLRDVSSLCPCIRAKLWSLIDLCLISHIHITVYETIRTLERQQDYVARGVSWTMNSKHLPQPPHNLALAFDAAPSIYMKMKYWNPDGPLWDDVGQLSLALGLHWGVWLPNSTGQLVNRDKSHHELKECECEIGMVRKIEQASTPETASALSSSAKG